MVLGTIKAVNIEDEMRSSYLDYAMSVIVSRALPDVRDGLKAVQRSIVYARYADGRRHTAKFRKSAAVVGSTLGRYHPHGDIAVYDALVAAADFFDLRSHYPQAFQYDDAQAMYRAYEKELFRFDQLYRHFCGYADEAKAEGWDIAKKLRQPVWSCYARR